MKKLLIATVAGTILLFALDYVWYGMIMGGTDVDCCMKEQPDFLWMVISYIIFSLAFAGIYDKTISSDDAPMRGINFGVWVGLLVAVSSTLMWYSLSSNMELMDAVKEMLYGVVKYVGLGIVVCYTIGKTTGDGECDGKEGDRGKATGGGERGKATGGGERGKATGSGE